MGDRTKGRQTKGERDGREIQRQQKHKNHGVGQTRCLEEDMRKMEEELEQLHRRVD